MSIIIAYKQGDTVYMGTDTRVIVNEKKRNELCECNYKIQKLDNGIILGITAERLERQTIMAYSDMFTLNKRGNLTRKHIVTEIIPKLINVLQDNDLMSSKEGELPYMKADIALAHKGVLYEICSAFGVIRYENFQALGFASKFVQATLLASGSNCDVESRIVKALDVAAANSPQVGKPYLLIDTKNLEYKLIGDND